MASDAEQRDPEQPRPAEPATSVEVVPIAQPASQALALSDGSAEITTMKLVQAWGRLMDASGFFPDTKSAAQAAVKILAGRELGFSVMQSMTGFHVIDGKVTASAHIMAHALKRSSKYDYRVVELTDTRAEIEVFERASEDRISLGRSSFTMEDAERAGLSAEQDVYEWRGPQGQRQRVKTGEKQPSNYGRYPRNMLFARAMSNAIAFYAPDVFETRVYTPDEIRPDIVLNEQGEITDIDAIVVEPREPVREAQPAREQQPQRERPEPTPPQARQQPPARAAAPPAGEMRNPGELVKRAHDVYGIQPSEVDRILGSKAREWAGREAEAWQKIADSRPPAQPSGEAHDAPDTAPAAAQPVPDDGPAEQPELMQAGSAEGSAEGEVARG